MFLPSKSKLKYIGLLIVVVLIFVVLKSHLFFVFFTLAKNIRTPFLIPEKMRELKQENVILRLKLEALEELKKENERLKEAIGVLRKTPSNVKLLYGIIEGFSPSLWKREVFVNLGKEQQVKVNDFVLNQQGYLVGRITKVFKDYSRVTLLNDPNFILPVFIGEKGRGLLKGSLSGNLKLMYVEREQNIKKNDKVWIKVGPSGFSLSIGKVSRIEDNRSDFFLDITVRPFADLFSLREVFVLIDEDN